MSPLKTGAYRITSETPEKSSMLTTELAPNSEVKFRRANIEDLLSEIQSEGKKLNQLMRIVMRD